MAYLKLIKEDVNNLVTYVLRETSLHFDSQTRFSDENVPKIGQTNKR